MTERGTEGEKDKEEEGQRGQTRTDHFKGSFSKELVDRLQVIATAVFRDIHCWDAPVRTFAPLTESR